MELFEKEIKELESLDNSILNKDEEAKQTSLKYDDRIQIIKNFQVEQEIKTKVEIIFAGMDRVVKNYIEIEKLLYPDNNTYETMFKSSPNPVEMSEFLVVLKNAYEDFYKAQTNFSFAKHGEIDNDKLVSTMSKSYLQVCYIKQNLTQFLKQFVYEEKRKLHEISAEEKERDEKIASIKEDRQELLNEAIRKVNVLDEKFKDYEAELEELASILPYANVKSDFGNDLFYLGKLISNDKDSVVLNMPSINIQKHYALRKSYSINLSENSGFKILYNEEKVPIELWNIIKVLTFKWITRYPGSFKQIMAIHDNMLSGFNEVFSLVEKCGKDGCLIMRGEKTGMQNWAEKKDLFDVFEKIKNIIQNRIGVIGEYKNIFEYNLNNPSNAQSLILVFVMDIDFSEREDWKNKIKAFLDAGKKVGIYFSFIYNSNSIKQSFRQIDEFNALPEFSFTKKDKKACLEFSDKNKSGRSEMYIDCLSNFENITEENVLGVKSQIDAYVASFDFIKDFQDKYTAINHDYSDKLIIPVGKHGSKIQTLTLTRNGLNAHAVIEGASGAGKTSMLNNIILSAAYNYSPKELEIFIFDFKNGNDNFIPFGKLKHVRYIGVNQNPQDTMECLQYIRGLLENNKEENKPRTLIVVDEYTNIKDNYKCVEELIDMVRKARSFGGDMLFSSQTASIKDIVQQCGNRFEMYESDGYQLIDKVEILYPEIKNKESRLVVFTDDKDKPATDIKFPYVGSNLANIINLINEKYKGFEVKKIRLDENPKLSMKNYPGVRVERQGLFAPFGERFLTRKQVDFFFDNDKAHKILLVGDKARAASMERLIANAFQKVNSSESTPCIYYLNFDNGSDKNAMQALQGNSLVRIANSDKDKGELLKELYELYLDREEKNYNGKSDFSPVVIILHCAGNGKQSFKNLEKFREKNRSLNNQPDDFKSTADLFKEISADVSEEVTYIKMLEEIFEANLDMHIIIHYQDWKEAQNHDGMPGDIKDFSDRMFLPTIPPEGQDDLHIESIVQSITKLTDSSDYFDEYYKNKMQDIGTNSVNRRNMLNYVIFIEKETPFLVMPYEYEV